MASIRNQSRLYRFLWEVGLSPLRMTELLQFILLAWVLVLTLAGFGGYLSYGEPMVGVSKWLCVLAAVHALTILFRKDRPQILIESFLPVPFLLYAWFNNATISPTPWEGAPLVISMLQAYCLFLIVLNSIYGRRSQKWMLVIFQVFVLFALFSGFFQFYLFPEWMPAAERMRNPAYSHGAAGLLQDPKTLGGILLAGIPICFLMTAKHFRTKPSWMLQCFLGLALMLGFALCAHRPGLFVALAVLLLLPLYMAEKWRARRKLWSYLVLIFLAGGLLVWLGTQDLRDRFSFYFNYPGDPLAVESRAIAQDQFLQNVVTGEGLGSFSHTWESVSAGFEGTSQYAHSAFLGILAELGIVGFVLAAFPLAFYLIKAFSTWKSLPFIMVNQEVQGRLNKIPRGHPERRRLKKDLGRMPTTKAVSGALGLGLAAILIYQAWDYSAQLPVFLMLLALISGILISTFRKSQKESRSGWLWLIPALLPLVISVSSAWQGTPRYYSAFLTYTSSEYLTNLQADPDIVFDDPAVTVFLEGKFEMATQLVPGNANAWNGLGNARLARLFAELEPAPEVAARALPAYQEAARLHPGSWNAQFGLARCKAITGADPQTVVGHLNNALELAPQRPEVLSMLGNVLLFMDRDSQQAKSLLNQASQLAPDYLPAADALERMRLESAGGSAARLRAALVDLAYLAEQHTLLPAAPNRVTGAGLINIKDPVKSIFGE